MRSSFFSASSIKIAHAKACQPKAVLPELLLRRIRPQNDPIVLKRRSTKHDQTSTREASAGRAPPEKLAGQQQFNPRGLSMTPRSFLRAVGREQLVQQKDQLLQHRVCQVSDGSFPRSQHRHKLSKLPASCLLPDLAAYQERR